MLPKHPEWMKCKTCGSIPESSSQFVKGGDSDGPGLPAASLKLEIVGAPYFDDSTSGSNRCIKRCPECGSIFKWENVYEYLVNGSEDDTTLVRLGPEEGAKAEAEVLHEVAIRRKQFQVEGARRVHLLKTSTVEKIIDEAVGYLEHGQLCHDEDLTFAMPAMIGALARHTHNSEKCLVGRKLFWSLGRYAAKTKKRAQQVLDTIKDVSGGSMPPEIEELVVTCKKRLAYEEHPGVGTREKVENKE